MATRLSGEINSITTTRDYPWESTGLLLVDPYNDFLSEGGKLWPMARQIAEEEHLLKYRGDSQARSGR